MSRLAALLRETLAAENLSERDLAERMGIDRAVLRTALAGGEPGNASLYKIAAYYQRPLWWALEQLGYDAGVGELADRIAAIRQVDPRLAPLFAVVVTAHPDDAPYLLSVLEAAARRRPTR